MNPLTPTQPTRPAITPVSPITPAKSQQQPQQQPAPTPQAQPPQPMQDQDTAEFAPSALDLMYVMACYCYIHANQIGYQSLKALDPNFVILRNLKNPDVMKALNAGEAETATLPDEPVEPSLGTADTSGGPSVAPGVPSVKP